MPRVSMTSTPIGLQAAARALCDAHVALWGELPDPRVAAFILANTWLETSGNLIQRNWGNIMATSTAVDYWVPPWVEDPNHRLYGVAGLPDKFRAYGSHAEGASAYLSLLDRRYGAALNAAALGDFRGASAALLDAGYCPDCTPTSHANTIETYAKQFLNERLFQIECGAEFPTVLEPPERWGIGLPAFVAAVATVAGLTVYRYRKEAFA